MRIFLKAFLRPRSLSSYSVTLAYLPSKLRLQWRGAVIACAGALVVGSIGLAHVWEAAYARQWTVVSLCAFTYVLGFVRAHLSLNHRPDAAHVFATFGAGNALTLARGILTALLAGFTFLPRLPGWLGWIPGLLFLTVGMADFGDGYVARRHQRSTVLGARMDITFDALATLVAVGVLVGYRQVPPWYLAVGLAYYAFNAHLAYRRHRSQAVYALPESPYRRVIGGFLYGYLAVVLFPVFTPPATVLAGVLFALPVAFSFGRDWLISTGLIDASSHAYRAGNARMRSMLLARLPVVCRLVAGVAVALMLGEAMGGADSWMQAVQGPGGAIGAWTLGLVALVAGMLVLVGAVGRLAALFLLAVACVDLLLRGFLPSNAVVIAGCITIMLLGTGAYSCWQPEDAVLLRRAGEGRL